MGLYGKVLIKFLVFHWLDVVLVLIMHHQAEKIPAAVAVKAHLQRWQIRINL